ncbi:NAD(P)-dependent oxidoreductase [Periweissella beninensis]|uniref:D-2-hydroxyacid dehydrogenase n=1 Tax=Periweissella beninensis TaxID=504936 RepID=A0ABT0VJJ4_9LACO|nr:NAD(P)-dependent oxidoreductase [Periweissella beninensis]MBM7544491.1 D-lactate dehydrogenase [Periweissella beninensis]MCM2437034.1 D-2-hydroxyacid dehydrogenase [Periweissella beninensis]MCT4395789.1 D-2-hydroxyacid dehydrogenase [Periweissella beninensis]
MTKILMTSVRDDEQAAITNYAKRQQIEIMTVPQALEEVLELTKEVDGVVMQQRHPLPPESYQQLAANGLKQLTTRTAGYDMINLKLAHQVGLKVTNVPAYSRNSVAEHALMQIFRILRKAYLVDDRVGRNDYQWAGLQAKEIHSATIGIIGVGRIGGTLARLLASLGARVLGYDLQPQPALQDIVTYVEKDELLAQADVVSLHVNLNPTAVDLLTATDFQKMKATAGLVNASRGPVVNTKDLLTALETQQIAAAALDTVTGEDFIFNYDHQADGLSSQPLIEALHALPNVILTPHIAFFTNIAVQNMVDFALDDVLAILNNQQPQHEITDTGV